MLDDETDETDETAAGFLRRAVAWYAAQGIVVERLLTDNDPAYRSLHFATVALELGLSPRFTQPYRPKPTAKPNALFARRSPNGRTPRPTDAPPAAV